MAWEELYSLVFKHGTVIEFKGETRGGAIRFRLALLLAKEISSVRVNGQFSHAFRKPCLLASCETNQNLINALSFLYARTYTVDERRIPPNTLILPFALHPSIPPKHLLNHPFIHDT